LHQESKTSTSDLKFAEDWLVILNSFFESVPYSEKILRTLSSLGLRRESHRNYTVKEKFSTSDLRLILFYAFHYQLYYRYEGKDFGTCRKIAAWSMSNFPEKSKKLKLDQIAFRSKPVINWLKAIKK
jgi:hypothetical protein